VASILFGHWGCFPRSPSITNSSDRHGCTRILRESRRKSLWARVSLRRVIKTRRNDRIVKVERRIDAWGWVEIRTGAARLRRLSETQHVVCQTIESHDPTGLSVSWQAVKLGRNSVSRRSCIVRRHARQSAPFLAEFVQPCALEVIRRHKGPHLNVGLEEQHPRLYQRWKF